MGIFFGGPRFHPFHPIIAVEWTVWCEGSGCSMVWRPQRPICANLQDTSFEFSQGPHQKEKGTSSCCWLDTSVAMEFSPAKNQQHLRPGVSTPHFSHVHYVLECVLATSPAGLRSFGPWSVASRCCRCLANNGESMGLLDTFGAGTRRARNGGGKRWETVGMDANMFSLCF